MNCPACGALNPDGKEFCGDCGAHLPHDAVAAGPAAETPPPPPPKKKTGLIIGIAAGVLALCLLGCCITLFLIPTDDTTDTTSADSDTIVVEAEGERGKIVIHPEQGFSDSMDALTDVADQYYRGADWWYLEIVIEGEKEEYYITPDETTYDKGVILEKRDGEWFVTDVYTVDMSQIAVEEGTDTTADTTTASTPEEGAATAVNALLLAMMEGRIDDAYAVSTPPMSDYDLSVFTGEFTDWEFLGADVQDDSSVVVLFTMTWSDATQSNAAAVVIEDSGAWYVSDMSDTE
ncbi:MAG: zinc ribbon domain-containing protein [Actinobacteria bacterium]|nr:zinc ribbon domain-containing protein [Actinomycetota bacterium]